MIHDPLILSLVLLVVMFALLLAGLWIGFSLLATGIAGMLLFAVRLPPTISIWDKIGDLLANSVWNSLNSWALTALPLFVLMGEILFRTAISTKLLTGLVPWLTRIPGRLYHINVVACSLFAAVSGSSAATTATVGKITLSELSDRGYDKRLSIGSLAGAGTLGFLIPPSLIMIIYGILSDTSIGKLFIAGVLPGLTLAAMYSGWIIIQSLLHPEYLPPIEEKIDWGHRLRSLKDLAPVFALIAAVLGGIYMGVTTPTEAAAIGVLGSLILALAFRNLTWTNLKEALFAAVRTSCMICFIIMGAAFLSQVVGFIGIARAVSVFIANLGLSPYMLIFVLGLMYLFLGMILDGISIVVMTLPIVLPIVIQAGFDPLWFGIFVVIMVELSQITPPVGFSIFVIQHISRENTPAILKATFPFFIIMLLMTILLCMFPELVFYLPKQMVG
ncbi:TRAP transporter large permease [Oceanidesulfovibrio marinus]|uniref:C4-dicarboxylate ABC transporter permease n=1 Tax=Oceanidesulfovibrio marinus TaxID=370038 RepID=A0A6P1ZH75_9BACT|nr:TRAP transporter large permease subunit [Oceanidesulfovibrio marinus]QJT07718.1 TRAP transporter large permease subunit [Oceanidesulfovibrio marinus]TVM32075.1 C4-dicarboxylate ABC transporter permease [Oceanidesulfovibrio marinus]